MKKVNENKKIVMLIDDSTIDNFVNQHLIESTGLVSTVYVFTGAERALDFFVNLYKLGEKSSEILPDYVFLDINMPLMNGFQFLDEINKIYQENIKPIKIVIITSSLSQIDLETSKKYKLISDFIIKPLTKENTKSCFLKLKAGAA